LKFAANFLIFTCKNLKSGKSKKRVTSKGRVAIPARTRKSARARPNTEVTFEYNGDTVRIYRIPSKDNLGRGHDVIRHLRGTSNIDTTTDETMALIGES
jgi:AbrB family looped-hinge helix DNA binding protein